ncbi:CoA pyrophosphatase [Chromobacterium sp. ATCC 53434]|uniref:CoA pyrophosphatase n=1 Tax=Chromobacterium sp. (strain ATCC 53434 / SC 14030) TaxID=2059672 RepID=UPI000C76B6E5|nr:CoA pyrophosphatase [Chromobacterium sp. ATCC 53434]AUH51961.1 CoA pyrophosphatase [Chromobacterium sp. ATCC 53434]
MWAMEADEAAERIARRLEDYDFTGRIADLPYRPVAPGLKSAAVLVPLVWHPDGATVLFTRRTDHLSSHPGQVSFPGGKMEAGDGSAEAAALREAREETGLAESSVRVLGRLPDYVTVTGYVVAPVVGMLRPPLALAPEPGEVAEVFEVPLPLLLDQAAYSRHDYVRDGAAGQYLALEWRRHTIWGATAAMLWMLADALA